MVTLLRAITAEQPVVGHPRGGVHRAGDAGGEIGQVGIDADLRPLGEHVGVGVNETGEHIPPRGVNGVPGGLPLLIGDNLTVIHGHGPDLVHLVGRIGDMAVYN